MTVRIAVPLRVVSLAATMIVMVFGPLTAHAQRKAPPSKVESDQATLVIMAPSGPVFADLRISVAKVPYRTWVGKFLATQLDTDKNGRLNAAELGLLTDGIRRMANLTASEKVLDLIANGKPADDVATKDFAEWLRSRLPRAFDLIAQPQSSDDAVRLASLIDADMNAIVTNEELQSAFRTLRFRDLDNDETFSVSELLPYRDPRSQNAAVTPDVFSLPFFHVTDDASRLLAADRIVKRYGDGRRVAIAMLRQSADQPADDQQIDAEAVKAILAAPVYHLTMDVRLSDKANTSDVDITIDLAASSFCRISDDQFGRMSLVVDGLPITVIARGGGANNRAVARGFLGQTFVMVDGDRNQYLDETEFGGIVAAIQQSGAKGDFAAVDANGDKMVTRDEVFSFVDRDQTASASRIEVSVKQDGKTLFGLLDANQDRRLSAREVRSGKHVLTKYDLNNDGTFAETELGTEYVMTLGLGRSELRRASGSSQMMNPMQMGGGDAILPGLAGLTGPEWFRRMDRNQDGDVSPREFLGSSDQFHRIDQDQDFLISATEAEAVK